MKRDSVSVYVQIRRETSLPLYIPVHIFDDIPPFPLFRKYVMNGLFLNQKANKNIRMSYSLKYKHSKKTIFTKK